LNKIKIVEMKKIGEKGRPVSPPLYDETEENSPTPSDQGESSENNEENDRSGPSTGGNPSSGGGNPSSPSTGSGSGPSTGSESGPSTGSGSAPSTGGNPSSGGNPSGPSNDQGGSGDGPNEFSKTFDREAGEGHPGRVHEMIIVALSGLVLELADMLSNIPRFF
jgi:hypothetical protein